VSVRVFFGFGRLGPRWVAFAGLLLAQVALFQAHDIYSSWAVAPASFHISDGDTTLPLLPVEAAISGDRNVKGMLVVSHACSNWMKTR